MKTVYIQPNVKVTKLKMCSILCVSGGVQSGGTVGRNFYNEDVTYSKEEKAWVED